MSTDQADWMRTLARRIHAACVWEATAPKPGNVHPGAAFADTRYEDFVRAAALAAPVLAEARQLGVGRAIREATSVTRRAIGRNTNLGIILLISPLAAVPSSRSLREGIDDVLDGLTIKDAAECYAAIRNSQPGGLGRANDQDVASPPSVTLKRAMQLAADRDRIAAQYVNGFADVLDRGLALLEVPSDAPSPENWERAIVSLHLRLMAELPDTLIARKCGRHVAEESARRAQRVLDAGWPTTRQGQVERQNLDDWLRADGNRRNPGTTADLIAAILFAGLRDEHFTLPEVASH